MSSEQELLQAAKNIMDWRSRVLTENPYDSGKTTDPEARDFSHAVELFRTGVQAARRGDLTTGRIKVAAAYLLDLRVGRAFVPILPPPEFDPLAQDCLLDTNLLCSLMNSTADCQEYTLENIILQLFFSIRTGGGSENQEIHAGTFLSSRDLIDRIAKDPSGMGEANPQVFDGCLTRTAIHALRCDLYVSMNNFKKGAKELTKALELDPSNTTIRARRVMMYYKYSLIKEVRTIVSECKQVVSESHPDSRYLRHAYAMLADLCLEFPPLGTFNEAVSYYNEMKKCEQRTLELYGSKQVELECQTCFAKEAHSKFSMMDAPFIAERKWCDDRNCQCKRCAGELEEEMKQGMPPAMKRACFVCSKGAPEGVKLSQCGRCKQVDYCSRECQVSDWKNHKRACKLFVEQKEKAMNKKGCS